MSFFSFLLLLVQFSSLSPVVPFLPFLNLASSNKGELQTFVAPNRFPLSLVHCIPGRAFPFQAVRVFPSVPTQLRYPCVTDEPRASKASNSQHRIFCPIPPSSSSVLSLLVVHHWNSPFQFLDQLHTYQQQQE
jgi:hypothetical protein